MRILENNEFLILNNIIYRIHTSTNFTLMRQEILEQIKMIIDFDSADFHLSKGDGSSLLVSKVGYNCDVDVSLKYENLDYSQGIHHSGKSMVYRESDIISEENRIKTKYYQKVYLPNNWHYALQLILAYNSQFVGVITFYKVKGKDDFNYSDVFLLEMLKEHLAYRIHIESQNNINGKISIETATEKYSLTKRESEILGFIMKGYNNDEICEIAVISNNTLKKHILNLYRKIGVNNRIQLFKLIREYNPKVV